MTEVQGIGLRTPELATSASRKVILLRTVQMKTLRTRMVANLIEREVYVSNVKSKDIWLEIAQELIKLC